MKKPLLTLLGAGALLAVVLVSFTLRRGNSALAPAQEPLPQDAQVQVYFNQSQASVYTDRDRQIERWGDDLEAILIAHIGQAQTSIDVAIQELRLPRIVEALQERRQAGVRVRVILEHDYTQALSELTPAEIGQLDERDRRKYEEYFHLADRDQDGQLSEAEALASDAMRRLKTSGIPWIDDTADGSKGSGTMHHKFMVIDNQVVITGSTNFTPSGTHGDFDRPSSRGNANSLVVIQSPPVAQLFTTEFALLWGDGPGGQPDSRFGLQKPYRPAQSVQLSPSSAIAIQFSPTSGSKLWEESVNGLIGRSLETAQSQVDLALFVFSDQVISDRLLALHHRNVQIRALIDSSFAYRDYSEGLDMLGVERLSSRCKLEEGNQPWAPPIDTVGLADMPEGDVLHHKFGVIDQRLVIVGSQNWSLAANETNDENLVVIQNPTVAAHYQREFDRLFATSTLGVPDWLRSQIQAQQVKCGR